MDLTLIIDNYDSFVYNIAQAVGELGSYPIVVRNDEISLKGIERISPDRIIISPGPGTPEKKEDIGISVDVIKYFGKRIPILGICLGHQSIGYAFGAVIRRAKKVFHGKISNIILVNNEIPIIYSGLPKEFKATRYHSLVVDNVKSPLVIDAVSKEDGEIMAIHHVEYPIFGVQFHPESIGTQLGQKIFYNFLNRI
ncbi:aminodeoxychorismate/anthranilate synthase component II [Sulfolobus sp. A20]|uniref:anthranilate synthase component II n=1 Tax=Sulfolobaceae TaxID=118883 RepID=UPI000845FF1C|nr:MULTISPECIES: aminodeoxychorismate/anthranilate synthase component II [unclassified Sulfolobus]TRM74296.1 aminodeoxychorismate/anthranilate synthase component II [Sulfolobus sp. E5]TRM78253.1 aminodeoxychorismate/anthranilate synthase component II [Sulfolobus sp. A20-N-F8]TRM78928.1 aminodeoxychorismate/anthranilate synthase component II [Sulfolobus sp. B5]TRM80768.1 aminodeoxychorismate/anthranilate synthase component II [Sulfolobus sp. D5]TRM82002.1 aminodeoxychorismate/anthranilate synth